MALAMLPHWCFYHAPLSVRQNQALVCCAAVDAGGDWPEGCFDVIHRPEFCCPGFNASLELSLFGVAEAACLVRGTCDSGRFDSLVGSLAGSSLIWKADGVSHEAEGEGAFSRPSTCKGLWSRMPCFLGYDSPENSEYQRAVERLRAIRPSGPAGPHYASVIADEMLLASIGLKVGLHKRSKVESVRRWKGMWWKLRGGSFSSMVAESCPVFTALSLVRREICGLQFPTGCQGPLNSTAGKDTSQGILVRKFTRWLWRYGERNGFDSFATAVPEVWDSTGTLNAWAREKTSSPIARATLLAALARVVVVAIVRYASETGAAPKVVESSIAQTLRLVQLVEAVLPESDGTLSSLLYSDWPVLELLRGVTEDIAILRWHTSASKEPADFSELAGNVPCELAAEHRGGWAGDDRVSGEVQWYGRNDLRLQRNEALESKVQPVLAALILHGWRLDSSTDLVEGLSSRRARVLDLGCGPRSVLGSSWNEPPADIVAVDPAGDGYAKLLEARGVERSVWPVTGKAEELSALFGQECFDLVMMMNALDHAEDPMRGLQEVAKVLRPKRGAIFVNSRNEGARKRYRGLHQWNLDAEGGRFLLWGPGRRWDVGAELGQGFGVWPVLVAVEEFVQMCVLIWKHDGLGNVNTNVPPWGDAQCKALIEGYSGQATH